MTLPRILVWFWSGGGGGSQFAAQLAHRLSLQFGAENVALSMREDDPTVATAVARGVQVRTAAVVSSRHRMISSVAGLFRAAAVLTEHAREADIVILAMNFAVAAPLAMGLRKPLVYCAHDPVPHPGDYEAQMQRWTQRILLRRADSVAALSRFTADALKCSGVSDAKLHFAPLGSVFPPAKAPPGASSVPVRLLFVGRMIDYKGLDILADTLPLIADREDWRLTIAGHGPAMTPALLARFGRQQVEAVDSGWLSEPEIAALLARHDVVIAPYRTASQSGVVAQAMAAGLPCVVTPVGALAEQIEAGRGGWVAEAATPLAFAVALRAALDDVTGRERKARAAFEIARTAWETPYWEWLRERA
jgi:glycosyltransferase involved in cell wall biosynthesis